MQLQRTWMSGLMLVLLVVLSVPVTGRAATALPALNAQGVLAYTNAERYKVGLPLLNSNVVLSGVAARKMTDLFTRQYFAHEAPTGEDVSDLVKDAGYAYITVGENLALGDFTSSKHVVTAWMDSPGHKANILSKSYSEIGIAAGQSTYEGRTVWMVVQTFGLPRTECPSADEALRTKIDNMNNTITLIASIATLREKAYKEVPSRDPDAKALVASYNLAAEVYNKYVNDYRVLVTKYNKQIDTSNACIKKKTTK